MHYKVGVRKFSYAFYNLPYVSIQVSLSTNFLNLFYWFSVEGNIRRIHENRFQIILNRFECVVRGTRRRTLRHRTRTLRGLLGSRVTIEITSLLRLDTSNSSVFVYPSVTSVQCVTKDRWFQLGVSDLLSLKQNSSRVKIFPRCKIFPPSGTNCPVCDT